jgi:glucose-6-phosphate isomerase
MAPPVTFAFRNLLTSGLGAGQGVDPSDLAPGGPLALAHLAALQVLAARRDQGELGFLRLPHDRDLLTAVHAACQKDRGFAVRDLVVVGIGGSALGPRALLEAMAPATSPAQAPGDGPSGPRPPRIHFLENADPDTLRHLLSTVSLPHTLFNIVSKSGTTAETLAQFLILKERVEEAVGAHESPAHFLFTTDPERGPLRALADSWGVHTLPVPADVGGRFSVLSPVGLFPAGMAGLDLEALLAGACATEPHVLDPDLRANPAGLLAALLHHWDVRRGTPIHVLMPYADRLRSLALWFQQLWAESLGKEGRGPTPLAALGAVDQHSLLQLFMEGPLDKVVIFLRVEDAGAPLRIPAPADDDPHLGDPAFRRLGGHTLADLLETERQATAEALRAIGRPSATLAIPRIDAASMGSLFLLFEVATVFAGAHYRVNPLDQPGVEAGKILTRGRLEGDPTLAFQSEEGL